MPVRLGPRVLVSASRRNNLSHYQVCRKVRESGMLSPARETRALPGEGGVATRFCRFPGTGLSGEAGTPNLAAEWRQREQHARVIP
jgi:hypothetical protein